MWYLIRGAVLWCMMLVYSMFEYMIIGITHCEYSILYLQSTEILWGLDIQYSNICWLIFDTRIFDTWRFDTPIFVFFDIWYLNSWLLDIWFCIFQALLPWSACLRRFAYLSEGSFWVFSARHIWEISAFPCTTCRRRFRSHEKKSVLEFSGHSCLRMTLPEAPWEVLVCTSTLWGNM